MWLQPPCWRKSLAGLHLVDSHTALQPCDRPCATMICAVASCAPITPVWPGVLPGACNAATRSQSGRRGSLCEHSGTQSLTPVKFSNLCGGAATFSGGRELSRRAGPENLNGPIRDGARQQAMISMHSTLDRCSASSAINDNHICTTRRQSQLKKFKNLTKVNDCVPECSHNEPCRPSRLTGRQCNEQRKGRQAAPALLGRSWQRS